MSAVVERYLLAQRVVARVVNSGTMGDPRELFDQFSKGLLTCARFENEAKQYMAVWAELQDLRKQTPYPTEKIRELETSKLHERTGDPNSPYPSERNRSRSVGMGIAVHNSQHGFKKLQGVAANLCYAILQQLTLPPKTRKAVEAAVKFWTRNIRINPSQRGPTYEETVTIWVEQYLEHLELFQKYEKLFQVALKEGKEHAAEGEGATKIQAGPFTIVNTGGFDPALIQAKAKLVEEAAKKMEALGLGKVCYGNVLITQRVHNKAQFAAFYMPSADEMFVRADAKNTMDVVRLMCHELTHRLEHKFLTGKDKAIDQLYKTIARASDHRVPYDQYPKKGEDVVYDNKTMEVIGVDFAREIVKVQAPEDKSEGGPGRAYYAVPIRTFQQLKGVAREKSDLEFVTEYAKQGGPGENFAEMVSFWAIGKLPQAQIDLLKAIL